MGEVAEQTIIKATRITCPPPGVYENVPAAQYFAWDAVNKSSLDYLADYSPWHLRYYLDNPKPDTDATIEGRAFHTLTLEGDEAFAREFVVAQGCSARKKDGAPCGNPGKFLVGSDWLCGVHCKTDRFEMAFAAAIRTLEESGYAIRHVSPHKSHYLHHPNGMIVRVADHPANFKTEQWMLRNGVGEIRVDQPPYGNDDPRTIITAEQADEVRDWKNAVLAVSTARAFIQDDGPNEVSIVWIDRETGLLCKARIDMVRPGWASLGDLKTTQCAAKHEFERSLADYAYERQSDWYLTGAKASGLSDKYGVEFEHFPFFCVEKPAPHGVALYRLQEDARMLGEEQNRWLLRQYAQCKEKNEWPGYSTGFEDISLPRWRAEQIMKRSQG